MLTAKENPTKLHIEAKEHKSQLFVGNTGRGNSVLLQNNQETNTK